MRVLVVTPMPRLLGQTQWFPQAFQSILNQDWDGQLDHFVQSGGEKLRGQTRYDRVTVKYEAARQFALDGGYDAIWFAEYDMLMPPDALRKLSIADSDISYGLYVWRRQPHLWSAYKVLWKNTGYSICHIPEVARAAWGTVVDVAGVGHGCTLVQRHVLERIHFYRDGAACADWWMALDAQEQGFRQVCDLSVVCGHMSLTPRPNVFWPDPETEKLYRVEDLA